MPHRVDVWTLKKYLLYDFAQDRLVSSRLYAGYEEAAQAAAGRATVLIVPLVLKRAPAAMDLSHASVRGRPNSIRACRANLPFCTTTQLRRSPEVHSVIIPNHF